MDAQHPATLATVDSTLGYYPPGALRKMAFGNGLTQSAAFNNTLQPCRVNVNSSGAALGACADAIPSGNVQDFNYGFNSGSSDNGDIASWTATGQQAFSRSFTYDALNRLATLNQSSGSATGCSSTFNLSWTYDAWGNRTDQNLVSGSCGQFHATVNTKNQLVDPLNNKYQYDAAGNMTNDGNHVYFYDAENRLVQVGGTFGTCSTATACYSYDAIGRRIEKATGSTYRDYLYDLAGNVVTEYCAPCSGFTGWNVGYVYLGGQMLAQYTTLNSIYHPGGLSKFGINNFALSVYAPQQSPCQKFSQSLADRLYNANQRLNSLDRLFDPEKGMRAEGGTMVAEAGLNVDEYGNSRDKRYGLVSVAGFKPELVTGDPSDPKHQSDQGQDVYHHILFFAGNTMMDNTGADLANAAAMAVDIRQMRGGRTESIAEFKDDLAGLSAGNAMVQTTRAGKSADYAGLARTIMDVLCI